MKLLMLTLGLCVSSQGAEYCFGFLRAVADRGVLPEAESSRIQKAHLAHMEELGKQRKLAAAGPLVGSADIRGLLIYKCESLAQARGWTAADPAVQNKRLFVDMYRWTGPAGIADEYWREREKRPSDTVKMIRYPLAIVRLGEAGAKLSAEELDKALAPHREHVAKFSKSKQVVSSARLTGGEEWIALEFFREGTMFDARKIMESDPAVASKVLRHELFEWMCAENVMPW